MIETLPFAFWITAAVLVTLVGISKAGIAGGMTSVSVPILTSFVPLPVAAGLMLPILIIIDSSNLWIYRKSVAPKLLWYLIPGAFLGVAAGSLAFGHLDPNVLKILVGVIAWIFVLQHLAGGLFPRIQGRLPLITGVGFAALGSFTSHLAHAGAPPLRAFLLNQNQGKSAFVGTFSYFFALVNWLKLGPYIAFGQISWDTAQVSAVLFLFIPLGVFLGVKLHNAIPETSFRTIAYILLAAGGTKLLIDGLIGLF